jgi:tetratricopeptide (TPR) repeat protein
MVAGEKEQAFREQVNQISHLWQNGSLSFEEALQRLEELRASAGGSSANEAAIENTLGIMHGYRSNFDDSIHAFERARTLYEQAGDNMRIVTCDLNLGETYRLTGNFSRARSYFHRAYEMGETLNAVNLQAIALTNEGQVWVSLDEPQRAATVLEKALMLVQQAWEANETELQAIERADSACEIHHALVAIRLQEKANDQAWQHALQALETARQTERPIRIGYAYRAIADVLTELGQSPDPAFANDPDRFYEQALQAFQQVEADGETAKTHLAQGMSLARRGKKRQAVQLLQEAMATFTQLGMTDDAVRAGEEQVKLI